MEFRELLKHRRMVRHYEPAPIPRETLERIVATVRRAPSGGFSQGQRLLVVDDPVLLARLAAIDEGLGAGVYGIFPDVEAQFRELLAIPDDFHFVAGVTLGRPLPDPEWSRLSRRSTQRRRGLDELV